MDTDELRRLDREPLADYVWSRLRFEGTMDPAIVDRFGTEPPERFLLAAYESSRDAAFRDRLVDAVRRNLIRLAERHRSPAAPLHADPVSDEHLAGLAYLVKELDAKELVAELYQQVMPWTIQRSRLEPTSGELQVLRALARLCDIPEMAPFWRGLWSHAPVELRGLIIFGWARCDPSSALERLGELAEEVDIDLSTTQWSLIGRRGPGLAAVAKAAATLSDTQRAKLRDALDRASGGDLQMLRDFDLDSTPTIPTFNLLDVGLPEPFDTRGTHSVRRFAPGLRDAA